MKKIVTFLYYIVFSALLIISSAEILSQPQLKHYDNWIFGEKAAITFNTPDGNPEFFFIGDYRYTEGTISYSDDNGELLYYLDIMFSSRIRKLSGSNFNNELKTSSDVSNTGLFIQDISNSNLIHLFTVDVSNRFSNQDTINYGVNYLLIDKSQDMIIEDKNLFINSVEKIAAVYNKVDNIIWVVTHEMDNDVFNIFKIDENGLDENPIKQKIGLEHKSTVTAVGTGRMNFSPNGTTLAVTIPFYDPDLDGVYEPDVQIFDFDPKTGVLSNPRELNINKNTYATCFSPNGKVLYVKVDNAIYQYDLTICDWDEMIDKKYIINTKQSNNYNAIERGPNGVIYCGRDKNTYLDAILNPDIVGAGCNYKEDVVSLGWDGVFMWGLPTVLNSYFIGEYDEPCAQEEEEESDYIISYPSPVCLGDEFDIKISSDMDKEFSIEVIRTIPDNKYIGEFNSSNSDIIFKDTYDFDEGVEEERVFEIKIKENENDISTESLTFSITYEFCCENTVKNNIFKKISYDNIFGKCNTVEYKTDMNFRTSTTSNCPDEFDAFGQLASSFQADRNNSNFFKEPKVKPNMLVGDPLPNVPQRAWYQENPTRKGTRYKFTAHVCNVEKTPRYIAEPRQLNFWLGIKNRNQDLELKRLDDVKYEDDWLELSDEFIANDNTTELAIWVLGESPDSKVPSYGFAIDDISLIPLPDYELESPQDTIVCEGEIDLKLENSFTGDIAKIEWSPTTGLDDPNSLTPIANPTESTTYSLKITDKYYCEFESEIIVEVDPCLDRCTPDLSVFLTDKEIELGESFCINGVFLPECEFETYLKNIKIYFEYDSRLLRFESASTNYDIIEGNDTNILVLTFEEIDFIINEANEFSFCFTGLLGNSKVTVLEVEENDDYNLIDYTNSNISFISCDQPFRQIKLIIKTDFKVSIINEELKINLSTEESGQFEFIIIDLNGKILQTTNFTTNKDEYLKEEILIINLEDLPSGSYFIRMITPNGKFYTKQFIKV